MKQLARFYKNKEQYTIFFSILAFVLSIVFILKKISHLPKYEISFTPKQVYLMLLAVLLMPINWLIEIVKWQKLNNISIQQAAKSVFIGVFWGQITPNRIGEPIARAIFFSDKKTFYLKNAIFSSFFQSIPTIFFGLIGLWQLTKQIFERTHFIMVLVYLVFLMVIIIFFTKKILTITFPHKKVVFLLITMSLARYTIFILQNILIMWALQINLPAFTIAKVSATNYLLSSYIPTILITEIGIKGAIAVFLYNFFTENSKGIIFAIILVWLINIVTPSLLGFIIQIKTKRLWKLKKYSTIN